MKKRKLFLFLVFIIFALSLWVYYFNFNSNNEFFELKKGDLTEDLNLSGKIITSNNIDLSFEEDGKVSKIFISPNDKVKQGELLASLDTRKLDAEIKNIQAQINLTKAKFSQLLAGTRGEELSVFETQLSSAEIDLENALKNFENVKIKAKSDLDSVYQLAINLADPVLLSSEKAILVLNLIYQPSNQFQPFFFVGDFKKKSDSEWQVIFTKDAFKKIKEDYSSLKNDSSDNNLDKVFSNFKVNLEIIRLALTKTSEAFESASVVSGDITLAEFKEKVIKAREDINIIQTKILNKEQAIKEQKIINKTNITNAGNIVNLKRASLREKEKQLTLKKMKPRDVEVKVYEAQIKELEALKFLLKERKNNTKIKAPIAAVVKSINIKVGQFVKARSFAISISGLSDFQIETEVLKKNIENIRVSDQVDIIINYLDETKKEIKGSIIEIDTKKIIKRGGKEYLKVLVASSKGELTEKDLNAKINLVIKAVVKKNILMLPKSVLLREGDDVKVYLLEGKSKKILKIKTGKESKDMIEVVSGLYEGDRVLVGQ